MLILFFFSLFKKHCKEKLYKKTFENIWINYLTRSDFQSKVIIVNTCSVQGIWHGFNNVPRRALRSCPTTDLSIQLFRIILSDYGSIEIGYSPGNRVFEYVANLSCLVFSHDVEWNQYNYTVIWRLSLIKHENTNH